MMYKSIFSIVAVAAVSAFFSIGCGDNGTGPNPDNPGGGDDSTYTVSFNRNGGTGTVPPSLRVDTGSGESVTLPDGGGLTRSGYTFDGWNTNSSGTGTDYSAGSSYMPTKNIILYAKWTQNPGGGSGSIVGDWLFVSYDGRFVPPIPNDQKLVLSFKSSGDVVLTEFEKVGNFWIESVNGSGEYTIKGDSVCVVGGECINYSISRDTLSWVGTGTFCSGNECDTYPLTMNFVKGNLANTKKSLGTVYSLDPELKSTYWKKTSENGVEYLDIYGYSGVSALCDSSGSVCYAASTVWYTDGSILVQAVLKCDDGNFTWENGCTSWTDPELVKYDYQLSGDTLRLRPVGTSEWDEWTRYDFGDYMNKSKAPKGKRAVSPFWAFRR